MDWVKVGEASIHFNTGTKVTKVNVEPALGVRKVSIRFNETDYTPLMLAVAGAGVGYAISRREKR